MPNNPTLPAGVSEAALKSLAERVEQLSGPNAEVDCEVDRASGRLAVPATSNLEYDTDYHGDPTWRVRHKDQTWGSWWHVDRYTASLDAAMTLIPEGWSVRSAWNGRDAICTVHLKPLGDHTGFWPPASKASSPALALTAAALRALAASNGNGERTPPANVGGGE